MVRLGLFAFPSSRFTPCPCHQVLETLLQEWCKDSANKVLIFTKSVKLIDMLEFHLKRQRKECRKHHIGVAYQKLA